MIEFNKGMVELKKRNKELHEEIGGIGKSNGAFAEEFFYRGLKKSMRLGDIQFHTIDRGIQRYRKKVNQRAEYDIILINKDTIVIVEVKYRLTKKKVIKFYNNSLKKFKKLFPMYEDFKIFGAVAFLSDLENASDVAKDYGLYVLGQAGNNVKIINDKVKQI